MSGGRGLPRSVSRDLADLDNNENVILASASSQNVRYVETPEYTTPQPNRAVIPEVIPSPRQAVSPHDEKGLIVMIDYSTTRARYSAYVKGGRYYKSSPSVKPPKLPFKTCFTPDDMSIILKRKGTRE